MFESKLASSEECRNRIEKDKTKLKDIFVQEHDEYAKIKKVRSTQGSFVCVIEAKYKKSRQNVLDKLEDKIHSSLGIAVTEFQNIATSSIKKDGEFTTAILEAKLFFTE